MRRPRRGIEPPRSQFAALQPGFRRSHSFTDRDQVDDVPRPHIRLRSHSFTDRDQPDVCQGPTSVSVATVLLIAIRRMCQAPHPSPQLQFYRSESGGCVPGRGSASAAQIVLLPNNADGRPRAGSRPATRGLTHPSARRLLRRSAIGHRGGDHPVRRLSTDRPRGTMPHEGRTADRPSTAAGQIAWQSAGGRRGTGIRVCSMEDHPQHATDSCVHGST